MSEDEGLSRSRVEALDVDAASTAPVGVRGGGAKGCVSPPEHSGLKALPLKERLGDREIPHDKEVQAGKKKVRFRAVRTERLRRETHIPAASRLAFAPRVVEQARA